jgi:hypothetical protein
VVLVLTRMLLPLATWWCRQCPRSSGCCCAPARWRC